MSGVLVRSVGVVGRRAITSRCMSTLSGTIVDRAAGLTSDQAMLLHMADDFASNELAPHAAEWDEKHIMPLDVLKKAGELGFGGMYVKEDVGGMGYSVSSVLLCNSLSLYLFPP